MLEYSMAETYALCPALNPAYDLKSESFIKVHNMTSEWSKDFNRKKYAFLYDNWNVGLLY